MTQIDQNGWLNLTDSACNQLEGYTSSPRRFFPYGGDCITGASTHCAQPRKDGQAELALGTGDWLYTARWFLPDGCRQSQF